MGLRVVTVFGASGFIGRQLVRRLARDGAVIRAAVRDPDAALFLKTAGDQGQVVPIGADVTDPASVAAAVEEADAVVNLVGILSERGRRTFQRVHVDGAANVARAAADAGVARLVHMSALGADPESPAAYGRTKAAGEQAVLEAFPEAAIIRPSVVFGPDDNFFNLFASIARIAPVLPVFGCPPVPRVKLFDDGRLVTVDLYGDGGTRFQPVYVGDVAEAILRALSDPAAKGKTYELGGPRVYTFKEIMELLLKETGRKRLLVPVPFAVAKIEAWFLELWPLPILTRDQVKLLTRDNVVTDNALTLKDLGIEPTPADGILPTYLARFRPPKRQNPRLA
jgi:NADH dehydrogenase